MPRRRARAPRRLASRDRSLDLVRLAFIVEPGDFYLIALGTALEPEGEHRVARHGLAYLGLDHHASVQLHGDVLDEVQRLSALRGGHGMSHEHPHFGVAASK